MNALLLAALLSAPFPLSQVRGTLDLADRTEFRGGNFGFQTDPALHAETVPSAMLSVASRRTSASLGYAPRIGLTDLELGLKPYYLHNGTANLTQRWRTFRLTLDESASYGTLNLSTPLLPASGTLTANTLLTDQLQYEGTTTVLAGTWTPRRFSVRLALSYSLSGGADDLSRTNLPLLSAPRAELTIDHTAGRRTHVITTASAQHESLSPADQRYTVLDLTEGLSYRLSRSAELLLFLGGSWVYALVPISPLVTVGPTGVAMGQSPTQVPEYIPGATRRSQTLYPVGQAVLAVQAPYRDHVQGRLQARLGPSVNRTTGLLSQQVSGLANLRAAWHPWQLGLDGNVAQSLETGINYLTYFSLQTELGYEISRRVLVEFGVQYGWQKVGQSDQATTVQLAFVAVTWRPATLRF